VWNSAVDRKTGGEVGGAIGRGGWSICAFAADIRGKGGVNFLWVALA
jgi:hypothetical protein